MEFREYLLALRRRWLAILACIVVFAGGGAALTLIQPSVYQSTSIVYITTPSASDVSDLSLGTTYAQGVVKSFADIATTPYVLQDVIRRLRLNTTTAELQKQITTSTPLDESVIEITASDSSPKRSAQIANAVTARLNSAFTTLSPTSVTQASAIKLTQVQSATPPFSRTSPSLRLFVLGGAVVGLLLAILAVVLLEVLDSRVHSASDVERATGRPIIGTIFFVDKATSSPLVVSTDPQSPAAEAFRGLRTNLQFLQLRARNSSFVITSAMEDEGKTTTAANLAIAIADAGERVIVLDADLRRPSLAEVFGLVGEVGLTDVLIKRTKLADAVQQATPHGPAVLPAGQVPPNPSELLQSDAMHDLLRELTSSYDVVLLDAPPLLPVTDAVILAQRTSGALVVAAMGRSRRGALRECIEQLARVGAPALGMVTTMVPLDRSRRHAYRSYATSPSQPERSSEESDGGKLVRQTGA